MADDQRPDQAPDYIIDPETAKDMTSEDWDALATQLAIQGNERRKERGLPPLPLPAPRKP